MIARVRHAGAARGPAALVVGLLTVAGGNVVFHVLAGRLLGPEEYGSLGALLTLLLTLAVPAGAAQVALTGEAARIDAGGRTVRYAPTVVWFLALGLLLGAGVTAAAPVLRDYLELDGALAPLILGLFFPAALVQLVLRSVLLGRRQYLALTLALVSGTALRCLLGLVVLSVHPTATAALAVAVTSEACTVVTLALACRRPAPRPGLPWDLRVPWSELGAGAFAFAGFWAMVGMDTTIARHSLSHAEAGAYAAAALVARTVLYVPQAVTTAALPRFALDEAGARRALREALIPTAAVGLLGVVGIVAFAEPVLSVVLGDRFDLSPLTLSLLATAALTASLHNTLVSFHLARRSLLRANSSWLGAAVVVVGGNLVHNPVALVLVVLAGVAVAAGVAVMPLVTGTHPVTGPGPTGPGTIDLTVVVPSYREGALTADLVDRLVPALRGVDAEVLVVDDGSGDDGADVVEARGHPSVRVLRHPRNLGKGAALRTGMTEARGRLIGFIDGDGDLDPELLPRLVADLVTYRADAAVGSKAHPDAVVRTSRRRRGVSLGARTLVHLLFDVPVRDTQTGVKVFRRELVADVLPRTRETGFLFDLELLAVAAARGWRNVVEAPVQLVTNRNSSVDPAAVAAACGSLVRFWLRLNDVAGRRGATLPGPAARAAGLLPFPSGLG